MSSIGKGHKCVSASEIKRLKGREVYAGGNGLSYWFIHHFICNENDHREKRESYSIHGTHHEYSQNER